MHAKCQEFVTLVHGPLAWKTPFKFAKKWQLFLNKCLRFVLGMVVAKKCKKFRFKGENKSARSLDRNYN